MIGGNFGIIFRGTISATSRTVGVNGLGDFTGFKCSNFRWSFGGLEFAMTWTLVGYFPKRRTTRPPYWESPPANNSDIGLPRFQPTVEEICSVSDCIVQGPQGWREQGKHITSA